MPLARILTLNPEDANVFARQLRELGFEVEVVNPNQEQLAPADLEIEFAICDQQQVLGRAAAIAAELEADVLVFPGAIPHLPKPIPMAESPSVPAELADEPYLEPLAAVETHERFVELPERSEATSQMLELNEEPQEFNLEKEPADGRTMSLLAAMANKLRGGLRYFNGAASSGTARLKRAGSSASSAVAARALEFRERMGQRIARIRAGREQRLVERRKHHAEAMQRASALEQERRREAELAAAAHQQELQLMQAEKERRPTEMERLKSESREWVVALPKVSRAPQPEQPVPPEKHKRVRSGQLRGAFAGAVAASFFFILGMILANVNALTPLSRSLANGSVEEQLPFGPTTLHAPPASTKPVSAVSRPQVPVAAPAKPTPFAAKPQPARTGTPGNKPSPEWHHFQRSSNASEDVPADDVVVKHFGPQRKTTQTVQQQAGLKHYSDQ